MRVMAICDYNEDYRVFSSLVKAREWAEMNYERLGYRTEIYRLLSDGSIGEFYETAPRVKS